MLLWLKSNWIIFFFFRLMGVCTLRKLQINGGRTGLGASGTSNGANTMVMAKLINGPTSGAALTQTHNLRLAMLILGMKGIYISDYANFWSVGFFVG